MMNLKRFIAGLSVAVAIALPPVAFSCLSPDDTGYFSSPFKAEDNGLIKEKQDSPGFAETLDFWSGYVDGKVSRKDIKDFFDKTSQENSIEGATDNNFYKYLKSSNDKAALDYIDKCLQLGSLVKVYQDDLWDYETPDPEGILRFVSTLDNVSTKDVFKPRYELLKIRSYGAIKDNEGVMKVWKKNENMKMPQALRDRFNGYVGGVLYREGKYEEALDYFCRAGDANSISWCIDKLAGSANLANLYDHNPNSPAIPYIMEDFMNYLIAATHAGRVDMISDEVAPEDEEYTVFDDKIAEMKSKEGYNIDADRNDMALLCRRVLEEGKTVNPQMWAMSLGVLQCLGKDYAEGLATLQSAHQLKGTPATERNLRNFYLWALLLNSGRGDAEVDSRFVREMKSFYNSVVTDANRMMRDYGKEARKKKKEYSYPDSEEFKFFTNFMAEEGVAHFSETGNNSRAMAFLGMLDDLPALEPGDGFLVKLRDMIDRSKNKNNGKEFLLYMNNDVPENEIDRLLIPYARKYKDLANDAIGTRLMREGNFEEALQYLSQVDPKWIRTQAIFPYLKTPYASEYYDFQKSERYRNLDLSRSNTNFKAEFCGDIIDAMDEYASLTGDEKAMKAFEIAGLCHFATPEGDGWALSNYTWSCYDQVNEFTKMAKQWLDKALRDATTDRTRMLAYYGLLSLPTGSGDDISYPIGRSYDYKTGKTSYYVDQPTSQQREALTFISQHWGQSDNMYQINRCDVLKSYVAGKFISKPVYSMR